MDPRSPDWTSLTFAPVSAPRGRAAPALVAELRTPAEMQAEIQAWRDLARRAVEPNVFAEPDLLLPAAQHLPEGRGLVLLLVWSGAPSTAAGGVLRALFPLALPRLPVGRQVRVWSPVAGAPGLPLVDRSAPVDTIEAALACLAARSPRFSGLAFPHLSAGGPFAAALRALSARTGRALEPSRAARRFVLSAKSENHQRPSADAREGRHRLAALGEVAIDHARAPRWVRDAVEELLALDASEAAERRGEALLQAPGQATFLRIATRQLARSGRCRVDVLRVAGRPAAAALLIEGEGQAWLWHVAADAGLAALSPATHLLRDVTRTQLDKPGLSRTEACGPCEGAVEGLWEERRTADYRIALRPRSALATLAGRLRGGLARGLPAPVRAA